MRIVILILVTLALSGCRTIPLTYSGGGGSIYEEAVVIRGAPNTEAGIEAENAWIRQRYPGANKTMQELADVGQKSYDIIGFTTADGQTKRVYFDITDFLGK